MIKTQSQTTFKDFQMLSRLGEGSYSSVYKVKRLSDNNFYAFKRVKMNLLNDKEKENALNEVRILASIFDPYIIGYKEAFFDENTNSLCIVMEYADGGDLQKLIKTSQETCKFVPEKEIWRCLLHIAKGLKTLHDMHILHRDLKCANVFISGDQIYKLGDMNVSKVAAKGLVYTQTGTPYYASPEVWRDEAYDMKSDIWSLGCVLYEMAALKPPFRANDMQGLFKKVQKGVFERIPRVYSDDLFNIICEFLKVQPSLRPNTQQILAHPLVLRNVKDESLMRENSKGMLLGTIEVPKNLKFLKERLPRANYNKDKLNNSFEKEKSSAEVKKPVVIRGESAGSKRISKYTSKESIFQEEIQLKLDTINKKMEEQQKIAKKETKIEEKPEIKRVVVSRKGSDALNLERKPNSRPPSRNQDLSEKKLNVLHSPLPELNIKGTINSNHNHLNLKSPKSPLDDIKPLLSPKDLPLENIRLVNDYIINYKSPSVIRSPEINNINNIDSSSKENIIKPAINPVKPSNIPIIRPSSRDSGSHVLRKVQRPYSHVIAKRNEEISIGPKENQPKPQIRVNARPVSREVKKNLRPLSGIEREKPILNGYNNLPVSTKNIPTKKKNVISVGQLHSNRINKAPIGDSLDVLKQEIQEKLQKPSEVGVVIRNKMPQNQNEKNKQINRVYSGRQKIEIIRKNSKNLDEDYRNVFRNKQNLQEKPVTAPNVSRGQYKIMTKEKKGEGMYNNYRVALGQQILNNGYNYKANLKDI